MLINFGKTAQRSSNSPLNGRYRDPYLHAAVSGSVHGTELNYMLLCCCLARDSDQLYLRLCSELSRLGVFYLVLAHDRLGGTKRREACDMCLSACVRIMVVILQLLH